jgi:hypothetical protein
MCHISKWLFKCANGLRQGWKRCLCSHIFDMRELVIRTSHGAIASLLQTKIQSSLEKCATNKVSYYVRFDLLTTLLMHAMPTGKYLPKFWKSTALSLSGSSTPGRFLDCWTLSPGLLDLEDEGAVLCRNVGEY